MSIYPPEEVNSDLDHLRLLFKGIRFSQNYQNSLKGCLIEIESRIKWIKLSKRYLKNRTSVAPKPTKKVKRRTYSHPVYMLLANLKRKKASIMPKTKEFTQTELLELQNQYKTHGRNWAAISKEMGKSPVDCYRMFSKHLAKSERFQKKLEWTKEEDQLLQEAVNKHGDGNWLEISNYLDGKSNSQCYHRWMKTIHPDIKRGRWSLEEDAALLLAVKAFGSNWVLVAEQVPHRTDIQCRERYCNILTPEVTKKNWSLNEDVRVVLGTAVHGRNWAKTSRLLSGRTDNHCRRRFKYLAKYSSFLKAVTASFVFGVPIEGIEDVTSSMLQAKDSME